MGLADWIARFPLPTAVMAFILGASAGALVVAFVFASGRLRRDA